MQVLSRTEKVPDNRGGSSGDTEDKDESHLLQSSDNTCGGNNRRVQMPKDHGLHGNTDRPSGFVHHDRYTVVQKVSEKNPVKMEKFFETEMQMALHKAHIHKERETFGGAGDDRSDGGAFDA